MRSTGPNSIDLSSQLPPAAVPFPRALPSLAAAPFPRAVPFLAAARRRPVVPRSRTLPWVRGEAMETAGVVHEEDPRCAVTKMDSRDRTRFRHHALELIEVGARVMGDEHADEIAVRADRDATSRMPGDDALDPIQEASLRVDEALTTREPKSRRTALHRVPEPRSPQRGERPSRPVACVHLDQRVGGRDLKPTCLRQWLQCLDATLERARIHGVDPDSLESLDERRRLPAAALVEMDPPGPAVEPRSGHGREAVSDQEERRHRRHRIRAVQAVSATGSTTSTVVPRPSSLSTDTEPPWFSTTWRTIERPRPVPPLRLERPGSTR